MSLFTITAVDAEQGNVTVNEDGTLNYTVPAEFSGDTITCTIHGQIVVRSTPADRPPVVAPDTATVMAGGTITIDVLGNDADPEGKALTLAGASADRGSVEFNADGTLSYTAPSDFVGAATITYTAADPAGNTSDGTVAVEVTQYIPPNLPPVMAADAATVVAGGTVTIDVLGNDADPEGEALTVTGAVPDRGSVVVNPDGTLSYSAPAGASGTVTITYTAADPAGNASEGVATVEIVALSIVEGEVEGEFVVSAAQGTLTVTVVEPAEDAGEYVLTTADLATGPVNLTPPRISGTPEAGAMLTALPGLWAFDEADGPLTLTRQWVRGTTPIAGQTGTSYLVDAKADAGQTLSLVETAATPTGSRTATSASLAIPEISAAWTPAELPGLAFWFDAGDRPTVTLTGAEVTELADKSGNGRHARNVAGSAAPTLEAELAGRPILRFPTGAALKTASTALPGLPGMPGVTVVAVTQAHLSSGFNKCFTLRNDAAASGQHVSVQTGYSMMYFGNGNRYWRHPPSGPVIAVAHYPANGTHGDAEWWRNGAKLAPTSTARATNSVSLPAQPYVQLGSDDSQSAEQAELLCILGPLSEADRQKVEGYLAHKWDLAAHLPAGHPYKASPPE